MSDVAGPSTSLVIERDTLWRVSCLIGGTLLLISLVVFATDYWALFGYGVGVAALVWGLRGRNVLVLAPLVHFAAIVPLLMLTFGVCASSCGGLTYYEHVGPVPTLMLGVLAHLTTGILLCLKRLPVWGARLLSAACIGGSVFYFSVLLGHHSWCASCMASHSFGFALLIAWLTIGTGPERCLSVLAALASAGLFNAFFHHRPFAHVQNDPEMLHAYMRDLWARAGDPAVTTQVDASLHLDSSEDGRRVLHNEDGGDVIQLGDLKRRPFNERGTEVKDLRLQTRNQQAKALATTAQSPKQVLPLQQKRPVGVIGSVHAPVIMRLNLDFGCPTCQRFFVETKALMDLIEGGQLEVQFFFSSEDGSEHDRLKSQAMANMAYAASSHSQAMFLRIMDVLYGDKFRSFSNDQVVLTAVSAVLDPRALRSWIEASQQAIMDVLQKTETLRLMRGVTGTPTIWLHRRGENEPARTFNGFTGAPTLRLAISSVAE